MGLPSSAHDSEVGDSASKKSLLGVRQLPLVLHSFNQWVSKYALAYWDVRYTLMCTVHTAD